MTEISTKMVRVFTTDSEEMANEIRHFPVYVMNKQHLQAQEMSDNARLAIITAIHMQQDVLAESIVDLSQQENALLDRFVLDVPSKLAEIQVTLKWCVEQANLLDDARRQLGDLWEQDDEFLEHPFPGETAEQYLKSEYGLDDQPKHNESSLDYCQTHDGKCDPQLSDVERRTASYWQSDLARESFELSEQEDLREGP
jgi:hypothetical protein